MTEITRPLLHYFGGKFRIASKIVELFPEHELYCEVFGGALGVLLNKPKSKIEVINDIDERIVGLYRAIRSHPKELQMLLEFTLYSRSEYRLAQTKASDSDLETARQTIVSCFFGIGESLNDTKSGFRNSVTSNTNAAQSFSTYVDEFLQFHDRLRSCFIENLDFRELIAKYDAGRTLFYLDPPYVHSTRHAARYSFDLLDTDHVDLLLILKDLKGMAVLSGYENDLYDEHLTGWKKVSFQSQTNGNAKTEVLWINPQAQHNCRQISFSI